MKFQNTAFLAISLLLASLMLSCSSMEVDTEEAYGNRLPPDFNIDEFAMINPDIRLAQSIDTISALNAKWEKSKDTTVLKTLKSEYEDLFFGADADDPLTSPAAMIAGEYLLWTDSTIASSLTTSQNKARLNKYNLYELFETNEGDVANALKKFIDDLEFNKDVYAMTYARGGKKNGRPYRECKEGEKITERRSLEVANNDYSDYLFCADTAYKPYKVYVIPEETP